jgi:hypothetical protein
MKFKLFILKLMGIKHGPWMIPIRGHYIFVDNYQQVWRVQPTHHSNIPLTITLIER